MTEYLAPTGAKAAVATAHDLIVIVWHVLDDGSDYRELGADWFTRHDNPDATKHRLVRQLQALGHAVDLTPPPEHLTMVNPGGAGVAAACPHTVEFRLRPMDASSPATTATGPATLDVAAPRHAARVA